MLVPLRWLREFVDFDISALELGDLLTAAGLEFEGLEQRHQGLDKVVAAKVIAVAPHPDADRLRLGTVDYGAAEPLTVVCGAPNLAEGMVVPLAQVGARLGDLVVKKTKIRGVVSPGMLCSERELGLGDEHAAGLMRLPEDAPLGTPITELFGLETEVLDISLTPNRGDCASILGIAREVATLLDQPLRMPPVQPSESGPPVESRIQIGIQNPEGCPRYTARMIEGVTIQRSPLWVRERLQACGVRPISNIVDVTNYVMLERGQPLHAFDYHTLAQGRIEVRPAAPGEKFVTLDGQERTLQEGWVMICDGEKPVALGGVMGGLNSEITEQTRDVLIESAFFDPKHIGQASRRLGLNTESAYRFARGTDREGCADAASRAALLMLELGGGSVLTGVADAYPLPYQAPELRLSLSRLAVFLGIEVGRERVRQLLVSLGVKVVDIPGDQDHFLCYPPAWRTDLERPIDLVEEVTRLIGFDNIPAKSPLAPMGAPPLSRRRQLRDLVRDILAGQGWDEAICYAFGHPQAPDWLELPADHDLRRQVMLLNPLAEDQSALRTSLLPNLLAAARHNLDYRVPVVRLFEVGHAFLARADRPLPDEPERLAGVMAGLADEASWWGGERPAGLAHARGAVEALGLALHLEDLGFDQEGGAPSYLDPEQWLRVRLGGETLGELGLVRPTVAQRLGLDKPVYCFDLSLDLLTELTPQRTRYQRLPRFPEVVRDLALVVDAAVPVGDILAAVGQCAGQLLIQWDLFDVYQGKPLPKGRKSVGIRLVYRAGDRTLTEEEVSGPHQALVDQLLERFQGELRL